MAGNLMKRAATYRKSHKSLSMAEAVKKVAAMDRAGKKSGGTRKKKAAPKKRAVKKRAAPKKRAVKKRAVGKVHKKKAAPRKKAAAKKAAPRKVKIKLKPGKKSTLSLGISGINHTKVGTELRHKQALESAMKRHQAMLKQKGLTPGEKAQIRNDIKRYRSSISESKSHISQLKRFI